MVPLQAKADEPVDGQPAALFEEAGHLPRNFPVQTEGRFAPPFLADPAQHRLFGGVGSRRLEGEGFPDGIADQMRFVIGTDILGDGQADPVTDLPRFRLAPAAVIAQKNDAGADPLFPDAEGDPAELHPNHLLIQAVPQVAYGFRNPVRQG